MDMNNIDDRWTRIGDIVHQHGTEDDKLAWMLCRGDAAEWRCQSEEFLAAKKKLEEVRDGM